MTSAPARGFLNWPIATNSQDWNADAVICGIPVSEPYPSNPHPNDQASAPQAIRAHSFQFCDGPDHWDFDLNGTLQDLSPGRCLDIGDFVWSGPWSGISYADFLSRTSRLVYPLFQRSTLVMAMGGDHGATIPLLLALEGVGEPVHIVHIDAHLDWRDEVQGVKNGYSSPLRRASEMPWISGMTQIGLRGTGSARREEYLAAVAYGSRLITASQAHAKGMQWVASQLPPNVPIFLTIDADGLDPIYMPAVNGPAPGGLTTLQIYELIDALTERSRLVGMDLVEIAPSLDPSNKLTCITAGRILIHCLTAFRRHAKPNVSS